jgi:hypothetical protein
MSAATTACTFQDHIDVYGGLTTHSANEHHLVNAPEK